MQNFIKNCQRNALHPGARFGAALSAGAALLFGAASATAGEVARFAAPAQFSAPAAATGTLRVVLALSLVLGAVFAAGWLLRRIRPVGGARSPELEILAQLSLGTRERAVLLRVGQQQLLVGVAAGCVQVLYQLPQSLPGDAPPAALKARPDFRELLRRSIGR